MLEITIANADDRNRQTKLVFPPTSAQVREAFARIGLGGKKPKKRHRNYSPEL